jgi:hypothetical protein
MPRIYRKDLSTFYDVTDEEYYVSYNGGDPLIDAGYELTPQTSEAQAETATKTFSSDKGMEIALTLFSFMPEDVMKEFANAYVKYGDADMSLGATRKTKAYEKEFGYLLRDDGTLIMDEITALSTKATYRQTLSEVGITDFTDFEDDFNKMITTDVSGAEFQQRVDTVYYGVIDQIPEVEKLYRERYGLEVDEGAIFAGLINSKVEDKVLAGEIQTLQLQAQASSRGFTTTFGRFEELRKLGLTTQQASQLYESAGGMIQQAASIGRELNLETLEEAALGDQESSQRLQRINAELLSTQGLTLGSAKKGKQVTGLIED